MATIEDLKTHAKKMTKATPFVQCLYNPGRSKWIAAISTLANRITAAGDTPEEAIEKLIRNTKGMKLP